MLLSNGFTRQTQHTQPNVQEVLLTCAVPLSRPVSRKLDSGELGTDSDDDNVWSLWSTLSGSKVRASEDVTPAVVARSGSACKSLWDVLQVSKARWMSCFVAPVLVERHSLPEVQ